MHPRRIFPCISLRSSSHSSSEEFLNMLWNRNVHYRVDKSLRLVPTLRQMIPAHSSPFCLSKIYFNSISPPTPVLLVSFPPKSCINFLPHSGYMRSPSHSPFLDSSNYTWRPIHCVPGLDSTRLRPPGRKAVEVQKPCVCPSTPAPS